MCFYQDNVEGPEFLRQECEIATYKFKENVVPTETKWVSKKPFDEFFNLIQHANDAFWTTNYKLNKLTLVFNVHGNGKFQLLGKRKFSEVVSVLEKSVFPIAEKILLISAACGSGAFVEYMEEMKHEKYESSIVDAYIDSSDYKLAGIDVQYKPALHAQAEFKKPRNIANFISISSTCPKYSSNLLTDVAVENFKGITANTELSGDFISSVPLSYIFSSFPVELLAQKFVVNKRNFNTLKIVGKLI